MTDWFAVSLRWLCVLGLVLSLSWGGQLTVTVLWPLAAIGLWNLIMSTLAGLSVRIPYHRIISVTVDTVLAGLFFWMQAGWRGSALWVAILPILTAAIYFELWGGLGASVVLAAVETAVGWFVNQIYSWPYLGAAAGATVAAGLLFGLLSRQVVNTLRRMRQARLDADGKKEQAEREQLKALYELTSTLTSTLSYKHVLDSSLDLAVNALNPGVEDLTEVRLVSAVMLFAGDHLETKSARRFTNADMRAELPAAEGILHKAVTEGDAIWTDNVGFDPELGRIIALRSCTSAYCFPLRSGFNVYGVLLFAHPEADYFSPDRRDILDIIARQAVIAIQNAKLYQDLVEEKERMVEVHEEARKKLARDLHDGPTQSVSAMAMRLSLVRRILQKDVNAATDEIVKIEELAQRTTKEIRHMLFTLRPLVLESQGLRAALQSMADKMKEMYSQNVLVNVDEGLAEQLEMGKQGVIFYIAEEAVNNARKHAQAANIWVTLRSLDQGLALFEIRDDGVGFDVKAVMGNYEKRGSLGMINLRERTELVNGLLHIDAAPGKGSKIQVFIPLTEEATDRLHHGKH
jgi:signal transduction histidine kinase